MTQSRKPSVRFELKLQDLWVGVFWNKTVTLSGQLSHRYDIWICFVPCVPLHITFYRNIGERPEPWDPKRYEDSRRQAEAILRDHP